MTIQELDKLFARVVNKEDLYVEKSSDGKYHHCGYMLSIMDNKHIFELLTIVGRSLFENKEPSDIDNHTLIKNFYQISNKDGDINLERYMMILIRVACGDYKEDFLDTTEQIVLYSRLVYEDRLRLI